MLALALDLVWGYLESWVSATVLSCAWWLCDGHVLNASDCDRGGLRRSYSAWLYGVLDCRRCRGFGRAWSVLVRLSDGGVGTGRIGLLVRLSGFPFSRVRGLPFIMTQALTLRIDVGIFPQRDGLLVVTMDWQISSDIIGLSLQSDAVKIGLFVATGIALILSYTACRHGGDQSPGRVALAIRDTESRTALWATTSMAS